MPKFTVWQCDRCTKRIAQEEAPAEWKVAEVRAAGTPHQVIRQLGDRLWCGSCWADIGRALPQAAKES